MSRSASDSELPYQSRRSAARYNRARDLPESARAFWVEMIRASVERQPRDIVDIGCGTGRFTSILHETFGCRIIGIDPSPAMLEQARAGHGTIADWHQGSAEKTGIDSEAIDLIFMSQAYHHLRSSADALRELWRVGRSGARFMIRNGTRENLEEIEWLRFFPESLELERRRAPRQSEIIEQAENAGFRLVSCRTIEQSSAESWSEQMERIRQRGLSSLLMIDEKAFAAGCDKLKEWVRNEAPAGPVNEPVDFLIFDRS